MSRIAPTCGSCLRAGSAKASSQLAAEAIVLNERAAARHAARQRLYYKHPNYPHPGMKSTTSRSKLSLNMSPASDGEDHQAEELQKTLNITPSDILPYNPSFGTMFALTVENWAD